MTTISETKRTNGERPLTGFRQRSPAQVRRGHCSVMISLEMLAQMPSTEMRRWGGAAHMTEMRDAGAVNRIIIAISRARQKRYQWCNREYRQYIARYISISGKEEGTKRAEGLRLLLGGDFDMRSMAIGLSPRALGARVIVAARGDYYEQYMEEYITRMGEER